MKTSTYTSLLATLSLLLIQPCWSQSAATARDAERQWLAAGQQLHLSPQQRELGLKEITRNCVPTPIPTAPSGPSWTFEVQIAAGARLRGTAWRVPCGGNDAQLILTLQPIEGTPFVCGTEMEIVIGAARTDDLFLDTDPNDGVGTSFCSNLPATASFVIHEFDSAFAFDDDAAFNLVYESSVGPDASIAIPAYDPALYAGGTGNTAIAGKLSGSYYSAARNGEGVLVEIGEIGARRVIFLTWYTYFEGQQRWIVGSADLAPGATSISVPLVVTSGGQFGSNFDPNQVTVSPWGSAVVQFPNCTSMRFQWSANGGGSGSYDYARGMDHLEGISCL
jgi:hypothetical protein